jgi:hypothetical protein
VADTPARPGGQGLLSSSVSGLGSLYVAVHVPVAMHLWRVERSWISSGQFYMCVPYAGAAAGSARDRMKGGGEPMRDLKDIKVEARLRQTTHCGRMMSLHEKNAHLQASGARNVDMKQLKAVIAVKCRSDCSAVLENTES